jgi:hypothetical protein
MAPRRYRPVSARVRQAVTVNPADILRLGARRRNPCASRFAEGRSNAKLLAYRPLLERAEAVLAEF